MDRTHEGDEPLLCMWDEASRVSVQVVSSPSLEAIKHAMILRLPGSQIQFCQYQFHNLWRLRHLCASLSPPGKQGYVMTTLPPSAAVSSGTSACGARELAWHMGSAHTWCSDGVALLVWRSPRGSLCLGSGDGVRSLRAVCDPSPWLRPALTWQGSGLLPAVPAWKGLRGAGLVFAGIPTCSCCAAQNRLRPSSLGLPLSARGPRPFGVTTRGLSLS